MNGTGGQSDLAPNCRAGTHRWVLGSGADRARSRFPNAHVVSGNRVLVPPTRVFSYTVHIDHFY